MTLMGLIHLSERQSTSALPLLQLSGILSRYGENDRFNMRNLDTIGITLQENITIHASRCFLERVGSDLLFLCTDAPLI
jgi:hypothetical protein